MLKDVLKLKGVRTQRTGRGGAFYPYDGLRKKFLQVRTFEKAFVLRSLQGQTSKMGITYV